MSQTLFWKNFFGETKIFSLIKTVHEKYFLAIHFDQRSGLQMPQTLFWKNFFGQTKIISLIKTVHEKYFFSDTF